jgi:hypothetical protein
VGVIGIAVFHEYRRPPPPIIYEGRPYSRNKQGEAPAAADAASPMQEKSARAQASPQLGTGHGRREYSYSQTTDFQRASSQPDAVLQLRYDSRENLVAMGVIPGHRPRPGGPDAFPAEGGYVPDPPPRWR